MAGWWRLGVVVCGAGLVLASPTVPPPTELSAAQRDAVDRGDLVVLTEMREASAWPAVTIYVFVDATPEEAAAVFTDYEHHTDYLPAALKSKISKVIDRSTAEVDYTIALPLVPDEDYTVRDHVVRSGADGYRVSWSLVRASSTKATVGHALFTPYVNQRSRKNGTLLEYYNFVTPGSMLAELPFIRNRSIRQITETARAVARQAGMERGRDPEMRPRLTALRSAVAP